MATHFTSLRTRSSPDGIALRLFGRTARWLGWWRAPIWALALFTGAKSFADNPILGSRRLNRAGLHLFRLKASHALAGYRRARLARHIPARLREQFDRDGFIVIEDVLPDAEFRRMQQVILGTDLECRAQQQGDTVTRRVPFGPEWQSCARRSIASCAAPCGKV